MKMKLIQVIYILFILQIFMFKNFCFAAASPPDSSAIEIGQRMPAITFENVLNLSEKRFTTAITNGKPSVIYFFSTVCRASFQHFQEIDKLYSKHKGDFNLVLVGIDLNDNIQNVYGKYSARYKLNLPIAFDKKVYKEYHINAVPHVIWIDKHGIVQAITNVLAPEYLSRLLDGKRFDFISYSHKDRMLLRAFDPEKPFLLNGNGGQSADFVQRSILSNWEIGMPNYMPWAEANKSPLEGLQFLQVMGRELADLYRIAYFGRTFEWSTRDSLYGKYAYSPILEIADMSMFNSSYNMGRNLFCYSQILPPDRRNPAAMMEVMQRDLKNFFSYDVSIETRKMPYLCLVATEQSRKALVHRVECGKSSSSWVHVDFCNEPVASLISFLFYSLKPGIKDLPLIDETGISEKIDISFDAIMTDFDDVKAALKEHGLSIVRKEKAMKVIVIKEAAQMVQR